MSTLFTDEQTRRASAIDIARDALDPDGSAELPSRRAVTDLIDLAHYVLTGQHPLDRYADHPASTTVTVDLDADSPVPYALSDETEG